MPRFQVTASLSVVTSIEPDGYFTDSGDEGISDFEDMSSGFYGDSFTSDGGSVEFTVEGEDDADARSKAESFLDNIRFESNNDLEWELAGWDIEEFEPIIPPMTQERAVELIRLYLDREVEMGRMDTETQTALLFLLDLLTP